MVEVFPLPVSVNEQRIGGNMTTYFYGRNSDVESYEKGTSIDTQLSKVKSYCNIKNLKVDIEITEQISGTVPFKRRPQGYELWKSLKNNDQIICSHLDRFSRNTLDLLTLVEEFKRKKIKLHFVDVGGEVTGSDSISSVFIKMLSVFAEFYSKQQSEKSKATKQRMIKENKYTGGFRPKFGYDVDDNGYLIPCEKEQSIIRLMKLLRKKGKSYKQISEIVTKSTRKKFVQSWVFNILKRESSIPPNDNIIIHNVCNVELQKTICDI